MLYDKLLIYIKAENRSSNPELCLP